jgi:hypothetical protein
MNFTVNFIFVYALTLCRFLKMKLCVIYCFAVNEYILSSPLCKLKSKKESALFVYLL